MRRFSTITPAIIVLSVTVLVTLAAPRAVREIASARTSADIVLARRTLDQDDILARINNAVRAVSDSAMPSVVHIDVRTSSGFRGRGATGSGWVYDADGHIVTNAHVVRDARALTVEFSDGRRRDAELIGADAFTDIAVLKVDDPNTLFAAPRATGIRVRSGDRVFSFGSPFGFKFSMSEGIVSGLGRNPSTPSLASGGRGFTNYIQHDAAVNPGNSGGPLVDVRGRVIGMNVAIATGGDQDGTASEGQSAGISFAIPLAVIESVVGQIIEKGEFNRGRLGIASPTSRNASRPIEDETGVYLGRGVLVTQVTERFAAERAGVKVGDIITSIAGQPTPEFHNLASIVSSTMPGRPVTIEVWRDGQFLELGPVPLDEFEEGELTGNTIGFVLAERVGIQMARSNEPIIADVSEESTAYAAGFRAGDEIRRVNDTRVRTLVEFLGALSREQFLVGQPVEVMVRHTDGRTEILTLRAP